VTIDRQNKKVLVTDTPVLLTHNLSKNEAEKFRKYENLALKIQYIWKLNNISTHPLVISVDAVQTFLKYLEIIKVKRIHYSPEQSLGFPGV